MLRFVNIKTKEFFHLESWEWVMKQGGLKNCLPADQWDDLWEEKAARENVWRILIGHSQHKLEDCLQANDLFNEAAKSS